MNAMRARMASVIPVDVYQRLLSHSILRHDFDSLNATKEFAQREQLWDEYCLKIVDSDSKLTFVEFGVHTGYSIGYFATKNANPQSVFIGLDSFEGLPENWNAMPKGTFDTRGNLPQTDDGRISFIKGWFQDTSTQLMDRLRERDLDSLLVHYDADLYSSTLFALCQIDSLKREYHAVFDEFTGHEARALYNYLQAFNASVTFLGKTTWYNKMAGQVLCKIVPNRAQPSPAAARHTA